ncbi:MAG: Fe-S cluster assembly protein SufD [Agarilytica sp.]
MSDFVQQALSANTSTELDWLESQQANSREAWSKVTFPNRKTEDWKYTSLRVLEKQNFTDANPLKVSLDAEFIAQHAIAGLDTFDLVFVNGYFSEEYSSPRTELPEDIQLCNFQSAPEELKSEIASALDSVVQAGDHLFSQLNLAQMQDGVYLRVNKNAKVEKVIRVFHYMTAHEQGVSIAPRLFVQVGVGAEASVVEQFASEVGEPRVFANALTEIDLAENAQIKHYRLHLEEETALHIGGVHAALGAHSNLNSFHLAYGGVLKRIDCVVHHKGQGAHCELNGIYLPRHKQHVDYHTTIEHAVPHCTTNEVFRGIISDEAKAVFNGRIHIHKDAQKTLAQLSNKNLLTSNKAEIDTKPELEIYADDVQCAHGATVAQLEEKSMHYLMTRGLSRTDARMMLSFGFINELVNQIHHEAIAEFLRPKISALFSIEPLNEGLEA